MKIRVDNSRNMLSVGLEEHESVLIGRCPPTSTAKGMVIDGGGAFDYLSNHALTIRNCDDRMIIENKQLTTSGLVLVLENSQWQPVKPNAPKTIYPLPVHTRIRVELFGSPGGLLTVGIKASGVPLQSSGAKTRDAYGDDAVLHDWMVAVNAVECNRRAGGKWTAQDAKKYYLGYKNLPLRDTRKFEAAYRLAAEILTGDPRCGQEFLLSNAAGVIDERLIKRLRELEGI